MLCKVTRCAGRVSANTRPHQLRWGDREMGTAISCTECSQVAGLIQKSVETPRKHRRFVQLSFIRRSYVAIDRHVFMYAFAKPASFEFPREKVLSLRLAEHQVG